MSELIYKQDAIDAIANTIVRGESLGYGIAEDILYSVPSAEPERKKGKWLLIDAGYYDYVKCSQCGETLVWGKNFCPNCGADMREGEKSEID